MKLKTLNEFLSENIETGCAVEQLKKLRDYSEFLKQPLKLEMFICSNSLSEEKVLFDGDWRYTEDDRYIGMRWVSDISKKYKTVALHQFKTIGDLAHLGLELRESWQMNANVENKKSGFTG